MAHHMYHTLGLILEARGVGEANKIFLIFTRELGVLDATAQSVREVKSKLRYALRDFNLTDCSLVRAKNGWKITGAVGQENFFETFKNQNQKMLVLAHVFALLKRLVVGEEKNTKLFDLVLTGAHFLKTHDLQSEEIKNCECILVLAILNELGYLQKEVDFERFVGTVAWSKELLTALGPLRPKILKQINVSLRESQM